MLASEYLRQGWAEFDAELGSARDRVAIAAIVAALTPPEGYVLVPVELVKAVEDLSLIYEAGGDIDSKLSETEAILAARSEVKP
ncbi:MAG TPA: hypothetical protein DCP40_11835 [Stenotrophomonas sp.]|nr:hypothetical protein [Stenotrophomonas sp.]